MIGLYIKYESGSNAKTEKMRLSHYAFDNSNEVTAHSKDAGDDRIFRLKCLCGADDWSDNGRFMHEYECICCGQYVSAYEYREPKVSYIIYT
jgi:hypothetical protein